MDPNPRIADPARFFLSLALVIGIVIAGYLTWHHDNRVYGDATAQLANCPNNEVVNCDLVNTSSWSEVAGIPVAAFAIPTYLMMLGLAWAGMSRPRFLSYAFCIGLLTVAASGWLFYVSKVQLGFVCLYCMSLYAVNVAATVLAAVAAWRSPRALVAETLADLRSFRKIRWVAGAFVVALAVTVFAQHSYRAWLVKTTARDVKKVLDEGGPTVPAVPQSGGSEGNTPASGDHSALYRPPLERASVLPNLGSVLAAVDPTPPATPAPAPSPTPAPAYKFTAPVRRASFDKALKVEAFDLQARLGKGKPVALIFWAPGFQQSERALVAWAQYLHASAPTFETYAVSGRRTDQKDEEIWEGYSMLGVPADVPLLIDDEFKVSNALDVADVPNVALFDAKGALVIAKMKDRTQLLITGAGNVPAEEVVKKVAAGESVPTVQRMFPYYPSGELFGACAPQFRLNKFDTSDAYTFKGKSASGRPTLLVFWSSTCKHCQVEIPNLVAWLKAHPGLIDVVSVTHINSDKPGQASHRKVTEAYIKAQGIDWTVLEDPDRAVQDLYGVISTPTSFFVSPQGTVSNAWYYAHPEGFAEAMTKELAQVAQAAKTCKAASVPAGAKMAFQVTGTNGKKVELDSLIDKPTLVHFWATWCGPCKEELPSLIRFRDAVEKSGEARVVLVSVENEAAGEQIQKYQKSVGLDLRSYRAPKGALADKVDLSYRVPRTYLIEPGGAVVGTRQGGQNWDDPAVRARVTSRLKNSTPS